MFAVLHHGHGRWHEHLGREGEASCPHPGANPSSPALPGSCPGWLGLISQHLHVGRDLNPGLRDPTSSAVVERAGGVPGSLDPACPLCLLAEPGVGLEGPEDQVTCAECRPHPCCGERGQARGRSAGSHGLLPQEAGVAGDSYLLKKYVPFSERNAFVYCQTMPPKHYAGHELLQNVEVIKCSVDTPDRWQRAWCCMGTDGLPKPRGLTPAPSPWVCPSQSGLEEVPVRHSLSSQIPRQTAHSGCWGPE